MDAFDAVGERYCSLDEAQQLRLLPIWVERIAFLYSNLWLGPMGLGLTYQSHLGQASELLHHVSNKRMTKHLFELEDLEDKVETASFAARFEARGRKQVELAADIAEAIQMSLNVFLGRAKPLTALTLCILVMEDLAEPSKILCEALDRDIDYVTGKSGAWHFRPLWPSGSPPGWPGSSMSTLSYFVERLNPARLFKVAPTLPPLQSTASHVSNQESEVNSVGPQRNFDVFICHASEDKNAVVRPLAVALASAGLQVWYDEFELRIGDSLRRKIDQGLATSKFGVVVLSPSFFGRGWPERELDGLVTRETAGNQQIILPIWHDLTKQEVIGYSPSLADRLARTTSTHTVEEIASEIAGLFQSPPSD
ncbi:toll/interleukin-1 receptor domain-containing protein [Tychonema sp. BBK16]|uniref:toll/interleukin-1 receptor domain-containing protein n=1 Tax=Tychonema sp. BBK16 TaxID=2699888 RepID=UPI0038D2781B